MARQKQDLNFETMFSNIDLPNEGSILLELVKYSSEKRRAVLEFVSTLITSNTCECTARTNETEVARLLFDSFFSEVT